MAVQLLCAVSALARPSTNGEASVVVDRMRPKFARIFDVKDFGANLTADAGIRLVKVRFCQARACWGQHGGTNRAFYPAGPGFESDSTNYEWVK